MKRLSILLLVAFTLAVPACTMPTYFRHPVSPPGHASYDEHLIGSWIARGDSDQVYQLTIERSKTEGGENFLMIALSLTNTQPGADGKAGFLWLNRIAYPSEIDGGTYYNIRAPGYGGGGVELDSSGPNPIPRGEADWVAPDHAAREYWIAKADISEDGLLRLRFIVIAGWDERNDIPAGIEQHRKIHGQGDSFWFETCGKHCGYARANLHPDSLIEMIRTVPSDDLFGATAGPFTRFETAAPEFDYSGFSAR